ncbi:Lacal_2735 family protein [Winogradskyella sp. A2]|uniref:Lacal_2735 family protein n=1 Tax=Winogradskyella sp. A2 TaxID=3366944 RepID=UPI00398C39F1
MEYFKKGLQKRNDLYLQYIYLIEEAYNLSQSDQAQSDISSYEANKILSRLKEIEFESAEMQLA